MSKFSRLTLPFALAVSVALAVPATGGAAAERDALDAGDVLDRFQAWLDGTRDLSGKFEQTIASGALGGGLAEEGRLFLSRPGRMRWNYAHPEKKVALIDGDRTLLYVAEDRQLWEGSLDESGGLLPLLLAGEGRLDELFDATLDPEAGEGSYRLRLVPRADETSFQAVVLSVRAPEFRIEQADVTDGAGNEVVYRFRGLKRNRGVAETTFTFEPPPGTEIVVRR